MFFKADVGTLYLAGPKDMTLFSSASEMHLAASFSASTRLRGVGRMSSAELKEVKGSGGGAMLGDFIDEAASGHTRGGGRVWERGGPLNFFRAECVALRLE